MSQIAETNFYVVGGTLQRDAESYVPRQADIDLFEQLMAGKFCYVLTSRQMGKSSLMVRTAMRLRAEGVKVAVLDLTAIGQNLTPEQWYEGLLSRVGQQLDLEDELEDFWFDHERLGPLQRWMRAISDIVLPRVDKRMVIFIDEIDAVRSLPFSSDEFFAGIREFYNRRTENPDFDKITFCLLGVATPSDLIRDVRTTPFNIGQRIELRDFAEVDALKLAKGLGRDEETGRRLIKRILYWTNGHPYLTQRFCQAVTKHPEIVDARGIDKLCQELFLSSRARETDDNLLFVRERILRSEVDLAGLLDLYLKIHKKRRVRDDDTNPIVSVLRLSGISQVQDGILRVRNRIYHNVFNQEWVIKSMPDAELRRQRIAFYRGLVRGLAIPMIFLVLTIYATFELKRQSDNNRRLLYIARLNLAQQAWEKGQIVRLRQLLDNEREGKDLFSRLSRLLVGEEDLRSFEWYYFKQLANNSDQVSITDENQVFSVAYSPDGKLLASGNLNGQVKLWDTVSRTQLAVFKVPQGFVGSVAISPDGRLLAAGSGLPPSEEAASVATVWDIASRQQLATLSGHNRLVGSVAFSSDGRWLATGSCDGTAKLWDVATMKNVHTLKGHSDWIWSVAFSPDSHQLATASKDGSVKVWNTDAGSESLTIKKPNFDACSVAFSPDGRRLVTGTYKPDVCIWDLDSLKEVATLEGFAGAVWSLTNSPDGKILATGSWDGTVKLWEWATLQELTTLKGHTDRVDSISFAPDGKSLVSSGHDSTIRFWNLNKDYEKITLRGHTRMVHTLDFSPDSQQIASGSYDQSVKIWNLGGNGEELIITKENDPVQTVAFSVDGKLLAVGSGAEDFGRRRGLLRIFEIASRREVARISDFNDSVTSAAFSRDGKLFIASSNDGTAKVFDINGWRLLYTLKHAAGGIASVAFSPDSRLIVTGGGPFTVITAQPPIIKIWSAESGAELGELTGHRGFVNALAFSPDGNLLATASDDKTVKVWDIAARKERLSLENHTKAVLTVAFSPDGRRIASGGRDTEIKLWDLVTGNELISFNNDRDAARVWSIRFSPDGQMLAAGLDNNSVKLWRTARDNAAP